jgi:hypothetical protein
MRWDMRGSPHVDTKRAALIIGWITPKIAKLNRINIGETEQHRSKSCLCVDQFPVKIGNASGGSAQSATTKTGCLE